MAVPRSPLPGDEESRLLLASLPSRGHLDSTCYLADNCRFSHANDPNHEACGAEGEGLEVDIS